MKEKNESNELHTKISKEERAPDRDNKMMDSILSQKKENTSIGQTQYPNVIGYHGTDDEKDLSPEE